MTQLTINARIFSLQKVVKILLLLLSLLNGSSCKKIMHIPPPDTEISRITVFKTDETAQAALLGIYNKLVNSITFNGGAMSLSIALGVYADELNSYAAPGNSIVPYYLSNVPADHSSVANTWSECYNMIYSANAVIEGINNSGELTDIIARRLKGEALFLRCFIHFYLVNLFGPVPYITTTDYQVNAKVIRTPVNDVYEKLIGDLSEAKALLSSEYPTPNRVRANAYAVTALLSRIYLYKGDWLNAELQATEIITYQTIYKLESDLNIVFRKESEETIWQIIPPRGYTNEGSLFILVAAPTLVAFNQSMINAFELNDLRKEHWVDSLVSTSGLSKWYYPFKYKVKNIDNKEEYSVILRLSEQYLIRAEARARQNKLLGLESSASDIDIIRNRAGLAPTIATTQIQLLEAVEQERHVELFTEWGHRFFDLKRWNKLDSILEGIKPNWNPARALLPLPKNEILVNPRLEQNSSY
jgi:hypothetical protein